MRLRNCWGEDRPAGREAKNLLNERVYARCPRAIAIHNRAAQFAVNTYFDCRERKTYPYEGGPLGQTGFTAELFSFLDQIVAAYISRENERLEAERKKLMGQIKKK